MVAAITIGLTSPVPDTLANFLASSQILQLPTVSARTVGGDYTYLGQKVRTKRSTAAPPGSSAKD